MPAAMEKIAWHMDDPRVGMCHQNWYVAKLASRFVKVCLAGAGGDELFGGYPWRYRHGLAAASVDEFDQKYFEYWHRLLPAGEASQLFVPELWRYGPAPRESFRRVLESAPPHQPELSMADNLLQRACYFEMKTFLHGFLVTEDRISMAHGLETRMPFLDNRLADLAWRIPPSLKVDVGRTAANGDGHFSSANGKQVLRRAMRRWLPEEFTNQPKQGFSPPDENWYRGPSMDYIKSVLLDKRSLERPWFDQDFVVRTPRRAFRREAEPSPADLVPVEPGMAPAALHRPAVRRGRRAAMSLLSARTHLHAFARWSACSRGIANSLGK